VQWFYRREEASAAEQAQAHDITQTLCAADPANADALYHLGLITCQGFGTAADPAQAAAIQVKAAALGQASAMFEAYIHYETGLGVAQDSARGFSYLEQAANAGHPRALYNMGAACATGKMVPRDMARAAAWYEKASNAGNLRATVTLATMYATGDGVDKDLERAGELFDEAEYMGVDVSDRKEAVGLGEKPPVQPQVDNPPVPEDKKKSPWWKFWG
jgi:TPR repeat protein